MKECDYVISGTEGKCRNHAYYKVSTKYGDSMLCCGRHADTFRNQKPFKFSVRQLPKQKEPVIKNAEQMKEMRSVITTGKGFILARCAMNRIGLITGIKRIDGRLTYVGKRFVCADMDCELRHTNYRNARLADQWQSVDPFPIGYVAMEGVNLLLSGHTISNGQWADGKIKIV